MAKTKLQHEGETFGKYPSIYFLAGQECKNLKGEAKLEPWAKKNMEVLEKWVNGSEADRTMVFDIDESISFWRLHSLAVWFYAGLNISELASLLNAKLQISFVKQCGMQMIMDFI